MTLFLVMVILLLCPKFAIGQTVNQIPIAPSRQIKNQSPNTNAPANQLSDDQRQSKVDSKELRAGAVDSSLSGEIEQQTGPVNILFVLDCSFSMKEKMEDHSQKMEAAKQVLQNALARIPGDVNIGLRVFGQGNGDNTRGFFADDCLQTALLVPLGLGNRRAIIERVRDIRAFGMTPLTYALEQAAQNDFAGVSGNKIIILISDGADTCGGDPCRLIKMLPAYGIKVKVDVVGLDLRKDRLARDQLNCITENSGGKYYDASSSGQLIESVSESVNKAIYGRVITKPGQPAVKYDVGGN